MKHISPTENESPRSSTSTVELNAGNFAQITSLEGVVLVDCWAPWCSNCDDFAKSYSRAAARHPANVFATLNTQEQKDVRAELGVQYVPSLLVYRDGLLLFQQPGSYDEDALNDIVHQAEGLDMDLVRKEIASATDSTSA